MRKTPSPLGFSPKQPSIFIPILVLCSLFFAPPANAQADIGQNFGLESFRGRVGIATKLPLLSTITNPLIFNAYILAGLVFLGSLIYGGLTIIINAGNPEKIAQGQKTITISLLGFLLVFASYWIIQIIEILTGVNILNPGL